KNNIVDVGIVEKKIQNNAIISTPTAQDEIVLIKKKSSSSNLESCFIREQGSGTRVYQENGLNQLSLNPYLVVINNTSLIKSMVHA
ncbi:type 2 periplasmic-binding domain-containing protein, partial [Staphylococcus xylosus]|nr:LysR family transcriptional regulator [Staphylococcus xylosus]